MAALIRNAALADLDNLTTLFDQYLVFYGKNSNFLAAREFLSQRIQQADSQIFVAQIATDLVGFTQLYPLFSSTQLQRLWLLNDLFVAPTFRGQGISVALLDRAKKLATDTQAAGLMLETQKTNLVGNQLYPKTGFTLDTEHHIYYWNPA